MTLPEIRKIDTTARSPDNEPQIVIWFEPGDRAVRYRWSEDWQQIMEETYLDGVVHDSFEVGGKRSQLAEFSLESVAEYIQSYRQNPEAAERDWPHIYELLTA